MKSANRAIMMVVAIAATLALVTTALVGGNPQSVMANPPERAAVANTINQDVPATGHTEQPGLSLPYCESNGISMYWHTQNGGNASAPDGWRVERRNYVNGEYVTRTWIFKGSTSDALQTFSDKYWDWKDTTRAKKITYTYQVRAINADESNADGREPSRRARVRC